MVNMIEQIKRGFVHATYPPIKTGWYTRLGLSYPKWYTRQLAITALERIGIPRTEAIKSVDTAEW